MKPSLSRAGSDKKNTLQLLVMLLLFTLQDFFLEWQGDVLIVPLILVILLFAPQIFIISTEMKNIFSHHVSIEQGNGRGVVKISLFFHSKISPGLPWPTCSTSYLFLPTLFLVVVLFSDFPPQPLSLPLLRRSGTFSSGDKYLLHLKRKLV